MTMPWVSQHFLFNCTQGRPQADATDAVALGPAPLGPHAMVFG